MSLVEVTFVIFHRAVKRPHFKMLFTNCFFYLRHYSNVALNLVSNMHCLDDVDEINCCWKRLTFQIVGQCCEMYERCLFIYNLMNCVFNPIKTSVSKDGGWGGKKRTALFQTYDWEKSSFFNALVRLFAEIHANTWQGSPVLVGLI